MNDFLKQHKLVLLISLFSLMGGALFFVFGPSVIYLSDFNVRNIIPRRKVTPVPVNNFANLGSRINLNNVSNLRINSISKDEINFYVSYSYTTSTENEDGSNSEQNHDDVVTAGTDVVDENTLGDYVANELNNRFDNVDTGNIAQQVNNVLGTSNWEAPASSGTTADLGNTVNNNQNTGAGNTNNGNSNSTDNSNSTEDVVPPSPTVYYPPYDGPPLPDVDNSTSSAPIPN